MTFGHNPFTFPVTSSPEPIALLSVEEGGLAMGQRWVRGRRGRFVDGEWMWRIELVAPRSHGEIAIAASVRTDIVPPQPTRTPAGSTRKAHFAETVACGFKLPRVVRRPVWSFEQLAQSLGDRRRFHHAVASFVAGQAVSRRPGAPP